MAKYRIKKYTSYKRSKYKAQKKSFFGFWYHIADFTAINGYYMSFEEAKNFIENESKKEIIWRL